jgi:hypothetical protein
MIPDTVCNTEQVFSLGTENVLLATLVLVAWLIISKMFALFTHFFNAAAHPPNLLHHHK